MDTLMHTHTHTHSHTHAHTHTHTHTLNLLIPTDTQANRQKTKGTDRCMYTHTHTHRGSLQPRTCTFEISTELQALADAALWVRRERFLDILHFDSPWSVLALPEQPVDKHLQGTMTWLTLALCSAGGTRSTNMVSQIFDHAMVFFLSFKTLQKLTMLILILIQIISEIGFRFHIFHPRWWLNPDPDSLIAREKPPGTACHTCKKSLTKLLALLELGPGTSYKGHSWPTV